MGLPEELGQTRERDHPVGLTGRKRRAEPTESAKAGHQSLLAPGWPQSLAYFIEREIEAGRVESYAEVARRLGISGPRLSEVAVGGEGAATSRPCHAGSKKFSFP